MLEFPNDLAIRIDRCKLQKAHEKCYVSDGKKCFLSQKVPWLLRLLFPTYYKEGICMIQDVLQTELKAGGERKT